MDLDALKKSYKEWEDLTKHCTPEEKEHVKKLMVEMQKRMVFQEPWLLQDWETEEKEIFLAQYTEEERENMNERVKLETRFRKGEI